MLVSLPKIPESIFALFALRAARRRSPFRAGTAARADLLYRADHSEAIALIGDVNNVGGLDQVRAQAKTLKQFSSRAARPRVDRLELLAHAAKPFAGVETSADEWAYIDDTSGTTKDPKGVTTIAAYMYAKRVQAKYWLDCEPEDLVSAPGNRLGEIALERLSRTVVDGSAHHSSRIEFDCPLRASIYSSSCASQYMQAPTKIHLEAKLPDLAKWKLPYLRRCVSAGEPLDPEVICALEGRVRLTILDATVKPKTVVVRTFPATRCGPVRWATNARTRRRGCRRRWSRRRNERDQRHRTAWPAAYAVQRYLKSPEETAACYRNGRCLTGDRAYVG